MADLAEHAHGNVALTICYRRAFARPTGVSCALPSRTLAGRTDISRSHLLPDGRMRDFAAFSGNSWAIRSRDA
ncbi:hypothetical protein [Methylobacterium gnaphalii]|uniref:hypothetical protein n=1 Tax=Methylobacterium gnaphalii TaxID=1010610 RepID=UPI0011BF6255|nr:hypothetical protein [Methylobacterium gnaphalii]